jgi:benzylsuccinate CoA-transferase BbsE subunit
MSGTLADAPLAGVIVVEHGKGVAASYAGRILALLGATVYKLEAPQGGDALRHQEPLLAPGGGSALFNYLNVGKSSLTLDVGKPAGRALLDELLQRAAIFIDDSARQDRGAQGLAPDAVCGRHPDLIYLSVLPFGIAGPHADYLAYELNMLHSGGEGYLMPNGLALDMFPDRPPVKLYGHFAEFVGGTSAAGAALTALIAQPRAGGQFVDVSVQDANIAISCFNVQRVGDGAVETRHGRSFRYGGVLECADGYVQILTLEPRQWAGLVRLMGDPAWASEPGMEDEIERGRRGPRINEHLRAWAKTRKVEDMVRGGQALNVPIAKYAEPAEVLASAQFRAHRAFTPVAIDGAGELPVFTAPFQFTVPAGMAGCPAEAGADNARVLGGWLGHSDRQLQGWREEGVI